MYGWRGRIGMLAPSRGDTLLYEFYMLAPEGVMAVPYSCELSRLERGQLEMVRDSYSDGVRRLASEKVDVISIGGTPPQMLHGWEGCQALAEDLRKLTDVPLILSAEAEIEAIHETGAKRIGLISPHTDELNDRLIEGFALNEIEVVSVRGFPQNETHRIGQVSAEELYRQVLECWREWQDADIQAVHITCPRWPTLAVIAQLEEALQVPVTSGAQAQLRASLRMISTRPKPGSWGSVMD